MKQSCAIVRLNLVVGNVLALKVLSARNPQVQFPQEWQFSRDVEVLLSKEFWLIDNTEEENA